MISWVKPSVAVNKVEKVSFVGVTSPKVIFVPLTVNVVVGGTGAGSGKALQAVLLNIQPAVQDKLPLAKPRVIQEAPARLLPSHCSTPERMIPSPQKLILHSLVQASVPIRFPSSHSSPVSIKPSPQTAPGTAHMPILLVSKIAFTSAEVKTRLQTAISSKTPLNDKVCRLVAPITDAGTG